jgi:hypothetical protein
MYHHMLCAVSAAARESEAAREKNMLLILAV